MSTNSLFLLCLSLPAICGGIVASVNSGRINDVSEKLEALTRRRQGIVRARKGFFSKWIVNPPLALIIKSCDWTDSLAHRGAKNGIRISAGLYVLSFWLLFTIYAFVFVVVVIFAIVAAVIALRIMAGMLGNNRTSTIPVWRLRKQERSPDDGFLLDAAGRKGQKIYSGTNWLNEELKGRVDDQGNIYSGTNWLNEHKIGKIDKQGNIFRGTSWVSEEVVGRIDGNGNIQKGRNWLNEEKVGRIDNQGQVYEGSNWLNEKRIGRSG